MQPLINEQMAHRLDSLILLAYFVLGYTDEKIILKGKTLMGFEQYHEPANELPQETRTFARMIASLTEEAEAIGWYEQRLAVEPDPQARAVMANAQGEEFKHFGMDLEFLLRRKPKWRVALQDILFKEGDIVEHGEEAEQAEEKES
jgi:hypothetical protein